MAARALQWTLLAFLATAATAVRPTDEMVELAVSKVSSTCALPRLTVKVDFEFTTFLCAAFALNRLLHCTTPPRADEHRPHRAIKALNLQACPFSKRALELTEALTLWMSAMDECGD
jgi:hypothetical protein